MSPQVYPSPETPAGAVGQVFDTATDPSTVNISAGPITMDDLGYNLLNYGMQGDPASQFSDWLGYLLTHDNILSKRNPPLDYIAERAAPDFTIPSSSGFPNYFSFAPPSPSSQAPTPKRQYPNCHQASPSVGTYGEWFCSACKIVFRWRSDCQRHIAAKKKQAI